MGRRLRSSLPMIPKCLDTDTSTEARDDLVKQQQRSQEYYNRPSKPLPLLKTNDVVRLKHGNRWEKAVVLSTHTALRSYIVRTADGTVSRRNRCHLRQTTESMTVVNSDYIDEEDDVTCNVQSTDNSEVSSD